jgi:hypothetical protein
MSDCRCLLWVRADIFRPGLGLCDFVGEDVTVERTLDRGSLAYVPNGQGHRNPRATLPARSNGDAGSIRSFARDDTWKFILVR